MFTRNKRIATASMILVTMLSSFALTGTVYAKNGDKESVSKEAYYFDYAQYAGDDDGFCDLTPITSDNVHYGWRLGQFAVSGFTRIDDETFEAPVFLKNVGDEVKLSFILEQDINKLNGDSKLTINDDTGWDEIFGIEKTHFGKGALIIVKRDYQNSYADPVIYTDYLSGKAKGAETTVELCEEGDYEVALDYSLLHKSFDDLWIIPTSKVGEFEDDYCIYFRFSVRNGNCMVYPMDVKTENELTNTAFTPNGFYLDLAKSRYLDIDISKQILNEGKDGLVEDTRFNQPARDGEKFTDEGIYNITVKNRYTGRRTEKTIYVGNNNILQAYVSNSGYSIRELTNLVNEGATIRLDGSIKMPETTTTTEATTTTAELTTSLTTTTTAVLTTEDTAIQSESSHDATAPVFQKEESGKGSSRESNGLVVPIAVGVSAATVSSVLTALFVGRRRKSGDSK